jgi:DNA invertase Pin-like site-specific DNA recombinase
MAPKKNAKQHAPLIRAYLRASTDDQDASRALAELEAFVDERDQRVAARYVENESGAKLQRPELFRLIADAQAGDVLLVEQVDRLSRLNADDWESLKLKLAEKRIRVVALDLPTSWLAMNPNAGAATDDPTQGLLDAVNRMLLDMLAVVARKDYTDRRRRQAQGIKNAKAKGLYRGRPVDEKKHSRIHDLLARGMSWSEVCKTLSVSRSTVLRAVKAKKVADQTHDKRTSLNDDPLAGIAREMNLARDPCATSGR